MRILLTALLLMVSLPGLAEWVVIDHGRDGTVDYYLDPATIQSSGSIRKVSELQNRPKSADQLGMRSIVNSSEYDCQQNKYRYVSARGYVGEMAAGRELNYVDRPGEPWRYVPSYTFVQLVQKYVCSR